MLGRREREKSLYLSCSSLSLPLSLVSDADECVIRFTALNTEGLRVERLGKPGSGAALFVIFESSFIDPQVWREREREREREMQGIRGKKRGFPFRLSPFLSASHSL